ncbi:MAG: hypothetical protein ABIH82_04940, partial [Candidatus Woesearchaeota archaeon]
FVTDYGSSGERMNFDYLQRLATEQIRILMPGGRIFIYPVRSDESFLDHQRAFEALFIRRKSLFVEVRK